MIQPPTDNLYKFLAVFGLTLIATSAGGVYRGLFDWRLPSIEQHSKVVANLAEWNQANKRKLDLIRQMANTDDDGEFNRLRLELESPRYDVRLKTEELNKYIESNRLNAERASWMLSLGSAGLVLGAVCSGLGFYCWYFRVQVRLDARPNSDPARTKEESA